MARQTEAGPRRPAVDSLDSQAVPDLDAPIGIFDSGVGGLTVARAVIDQLPAEQVVYVGDTAHGPYGPLPIADIRRHALALGDALVDRGIKVLVVACNTASAACLADIRERYPVPVVEVILPAVRRAVAATRTGRIGVIGTRATIASGAYQDTFAAARDVEVTAAACPRFVDFVERGMTSGRQILGLAQCYLEPLQEARVDTVVLGCTHYPLLAGVLQIVLGPDVTLVSSADETGKDLVRVLMARDLARDPGGPAARAARVPRHRRPRAVPPAGPPLPRPGDRRGRRAGRGGGLTRARPRPTSEARSHVAGGAGCAGVGARTGRPWARGSVAS